MVVSSDCISTPAMDAINTMLVAKGFWPSCCPVVCVADIESSPQRAGSEEDMVRMRVSPCAASRPKIVGESEAAAVPEFKIVALINLIFNHQRGARAAKNRFAGSGPSRG